MDKPDRALCHVIFEWLGDAVGVVALFGVLWFGLWIIAAMQ